MGEDDAEKPVSMEKRDVAADARQYSPSAARNREPILQVLRRALPGLASVLEIGSGTGEHAVYFAKALPGVRWQPSEPDAASRASIEAWIRAEGVANVAAPLDIDVCADVWGTSQTQAYDAIVSINMIHIAPWEATLGLFAGSERVLKAGGVLFLYGPFMRDGRHTAPSNAEFDASLKARDPRWGLRDIAHLARIGEMHRLSLRQTVPMPANNFSLIFGRPSRAKRRPKVKITHVAGRSRGEAAPARLRRRFSLAH
jgi:SAM-dependent methyltransferase